jgi:hypothetical protein
MDYQSVCDTLRKTYNINFLDLDENKIIGQEFAKAAEIYRDSKKGNKVLIDLVYNHYNVKKPFPDFIGGPQTLTMHWSNRWKKIIYIFGEQHSNEIDCEKRLNTKKWVPIQNFLEDLILKTDVYLDIYFEFPAIQKSERRYYDTFKPFPTDSRMDTLFQRFKKYVQPGTKNDEDLVRVHYFDSRVEDDQGARIGVCDVNWFEIKTLGFIQLNLVYNLKELVRDNPRFQSILKSLGLKDDKLFIDFWMKQYKENKYNASALLNCPVQAEILKFIEDELRLELKSDDFVKLRNMLIKYIPYILSDTLEDDSIVPFFEFIIKSINVPKAFIADVYTLASIFKDFENVTKQPSQQNSVIIYGGNAHSEIYRKFLTYMYFEELIIEGKPSTENEKATCVDMKKLEKPFFSDWLGYKSKPFVSDLKAADFGCTLPKADKIHKGEEGQRQLILLDTLKMFEENDAQYHQLAFENLTRWAAEAMPQSSIRECVVIVKPGDWGEVTLDMTKKYGVCFASLNMANAYGPGGGYTDGMVAQEENMFRRTDCHFAIVRKTFMRSDGSEQYTSEQSDLINGVNGRVYLDIDHPRVCIRGPEKRSLRNLGYDWLSDDNIFPFYELRAAAVDLRSGEAYNHNETRKRVAAQLDTLIEAGVRHVVLSAFGCGAFMNPANYVASAYHEALKERFMHFDVVAFGIFNAGYGPNNFAAFEEEFKSWKVQ